MNKFFDLENQMLYLKRKYWEIEKSSLTVDMSLPSHFFNNKVRRYLSALYNLDKRLVYKYLIAEGGKEYLVLKEDKEDVIAALELFSESFNECLFKTCFIEFIKNLKDENPVLSFEKFILQSEHKNSVIN